MIQSSSRPWPSPLIINKYPGLCETHCQQAFSGTATTTGMSHCGPGASGTWACDHMTKDHRHFARKRGRAPRDTFSNRATHSRHIRGLTATCLSSRPPAYTSVVNLQLGAALSENGHGRKCRSTVHHSTTLMIHPLGITWFPSLATFEFHCSSSAQLMETIYKPHTHHV